MSQKKRTTVTTIETHEVWIIRRPASEVPDEFGTGMPVDIAQPPAAVSPPSKLNSASETSEEYES